MKVTINWFKEKSTLGHTLSWNCSSEMLEKPFNKEFYLLYEMNFVYILEMNKIAFYKWYFPLSTLGWNEHAKDVYIFQKSS